jgi:hypothetical protein
MRNMLSFKSFLLYKWSIFRFAAFKISFFQLF